MGKNEIQIWISKFELDVRNTLTLRVVTIKIMPGLQILSFQAVKPYSE